MKPESRSQDDPNRVNPITDAFGERDPEIRDQIGMPAADDEPGQVIVELNLLHEVGLKGAQERFNEVYARVVLANDPGRGEPQLVANTYYRCHLSMHEVRELVGEDFRGTTARERSIYRVWPDFPIRPLIDQSVATVKGDAARRSFDATGADIAWAVIDSGIDASHPHFRHYGNLEGVVAGLHRDFTGAGAAPSEGSASALTDVLGHGTHVAGIIAGGLPPDTAAGRVVVGRRVAMGDELKIEQIERRELEDVVRLAGVAPRAKLVSLKVLTEEGAIANSRPRASSVMEALQYIREEVNGSGKLMRIHGVNISLGYDFNAQWFACGQSPVCLEVDRLVRSGVVVVIAAGNTGYGRITAATRSMATGIGMTINDPGNAALAMTVGATHRDSPHTYGVSYFSSKGPTGDGRLKPDVVAPGERITSAAAGRLRGEMETLITSTSGQDTIPYIEYSGTSMAAPHVSGAVAAFLSIRREFIGRPEEVMRIFTSTATSLGRERYFEGYGMIDLMRAIQSV